ncbi:uncharacterized protein PHACADRAFT_251468 [Phanerochaete carnosa HHB-10118-sp]|uniref:Uncharacterized protein n=1 Tax=Phanerochaete carnosa (strain HHB-10118-sp) TaxID=650164 RepID=K5WEG0_PHACS|nr:uncharacterized protein PHACADRAFT_251468 [Phanerochaete carnosa HHB-10118-sp]EKM57685.1 hypothetical protein PHACADRAFT_251468 [Phanerochaete carnosa HHB-10118-sp]
MWAIAFTPAVATFLKLTLTIGWNNVLPRSNMARVKDSQRLDQATRDRLARWAGAHQNGMENLPLWTGAVLAGYIAGIPHRTLNTYAVEYIGLRLLYTFIYTNQTTEVVGYLRTVTFFAGVPLPVILLIKAANKIAATGI